MAGSSSVGVSVDDIELREEAICEVGMEKGSKILTRRGKQVLDDENFRSRDFWQGYKLYCFARYSHCMRSRRRFLSSKMGRVVRLLQKGKQVSWGAVFDGTVREVWAMMEDYAETTRGQDWRNLRPLMEKFDDVKKLSSSEKGTLLMQLVEEDECVNERHKLKLNVARQSSPDIFDEIRGRLKRMHMDLEKLKQSSTAKAGSGKRSGSVTTL